LRRSLEGPKNTTIYRAKTYISGGRGWGQRRPI